jgi:glycosyltransferase involved in cell wall biosynthesis
VVITNWKDIVHPESGGAEVFCEELRRGLAAHGVEVTLLTSRPPQFAKYARDELGLVIRLGNRLTTYPRVLLWLLMHRRMFDAVVDSQNGIPYFSPLVVSRRKPVTLVVHHVHQEQFAEYFPPFVSAVGRFAEKQFCNAVYGDRPVCAVSPTTRRDLRRVLQVRGPIYVTPNGLTAELLEAAGKPDDKLFTRSGDPSIVYVGRIVVHKRLHLLVEAIPTVLQAVPSLRVHLVGSGQELASIRQLVTDLGLDQNVIVHGRLDAATRDQLVAEAWLTVNPSAREGWGVSIIESAAYGVPAIAFAVPGICDSVKHGETGWLLSEGSDDLSSAIVDALRRLDSLEEARQWSRRCKEWASCFSWDATSQRVLTLIHDSSRLAELTTRDRRRSTDANTLVQVCPEHVASAGHAVGLRRLDQVRSRAGVMEILLGQCEPTSAELVMKRVGLSAASTDGLRLAAESDLLGWPN